MKNIREVYELDEFYDYKPLLKSFGYKIIVQVDEMNYQGDSIVLFKDKEKYGLLIFGWGSCSGCDMLQSCTSYEQLEKLQKYLYNAIIWSDSLETMMKKVNAKEWGMTHLDRKLVRNFITKVKRYYEKNKEEE